MFEDLLKSGISDLKRGQEFLYRKLNSTNQEFLNKFIYYLKSNKLDQHRIELMITLCINEIEKKNYPPQNEDYLNKINASLKSKISLNQKLERAIHVIPFLLQYKVTLSEGVELGQVWDDILKYVNT